jgi:hypothetical protein
MGVPEAWGFNPFTRLAYLAARTERVQLATTIINVFFAIAVDDRHQRRQSRQALRRAIPPWLGQLRRCHRRLPFTKVLSRIVDVIGVCRIAWRREKIVYAGKAVSVRHCRPTKGRARQAAQLDGLPSAARYPDLVAQGTPPGVQSSCNRDRDSRASGGHRRARADSCELPVYLDVF